MEKGSGRVIIQQVTFSKTGRTLPIDFSHLSSSRPTITTMPCVTLHPPSPRGQGSHHNLENPLPHLLQTPSGLAILELQGTINTPSAVETSNDNVESDHRGTSVGRIVFPDYRKDDPLDSDVWMKKVHLYVGRYQRLTGEVKKLSNPIALIRKRSDARATEAEELEIADIVYYKILFSSRPEPVGS